MAAESEEWTKFGVAIADGVDWWSHFRGGMQYTLAI